MKSLNSAFHFDLAGRRRRAWLPIIAALAMIAVPAAAQTAAPGPVHFPAQNAAPAASPAPPPVAAPAIDVTDIRDIRGPISIPYEWLWAAYIAGGVALVALLYAAWRFFRRQRAARSKQAFEIALEQLEAARELMAPATVRDYAFTVSEIVRLYIEQRFGERAAHRTTEEFLTDLVQQTGTPLAPHRRRLEDFLHHCDLMKFARWQLSVPELESMHESARVFVLETRPQPEPARVAAKPDSAATPEHPELAEAK